MIRSIVIAILAVIPTIILHELAHGYAALAMGDNTAQRAGRLSFNPLRHVDRFGTVILPLILLVGQLVTIGRVEFMFGWAKPVPIDPSGFRDPRRGMALIAAAGPAMNFALALVAAFAFSRVAAPLPGLGSFGSGAVADFLLYFLLFNLVLGLFNLIPLPPLDGGRIMVGILPLALARVYARIEGLGILIVLLIIFILPSLLASFGIAFDPVGVLLGRVVPRIAQAFLGFAGVHVRF